MPDASHGRPSSIPIGDGKTYAISLPYVLDGKVSTHPPEARGWAAFNTYVLVEGKSALIIDTGVTAHQDMLLEQLNEIIDPSTEVSFWALRIGEFPSVCNIEAIAERFSAGTFYGSQPGPADYWADIHAGDTPSAQSLDGVEAVQVRKGNTVSVDEAGTRQVLVVDPPLRLLQTHWAYDEQARTLYTSDAFTHVPSPSSSGPWVLRDGDEDPTTVESMRQHLLRTRFWWLHGANIDPIRTAIDHIFETHDIETIAPACGGIINGRQTVERHRRLLDEVLSTEAQEPSSYVPGIGSTKDYWEVAR